MLRLFEDKSPVWRTRVIREGVDVAEAHKLSAFLENDSMNSFRFRRICYTDQHVYFMRHNATENTSFIYFFKVPNEISSN